VFCESVMTASDEAALDAVDAKSPALDAMLCATASGAPAVTNDEACELAATATTAALSATESAETATTAAESALESVTTAVELQAEITSASESNCESTVDCKAE
jgi:hypothetical protein